MNDLLTNEQKIKASILAVEATRFEQLCLWEEHKQYLSDSNSHCIIKVGEIYKKPVNIEITFSNYDGVPFIFWDACSMLVDHLQIETWLKQHGFNHHHNCMNFHNVISEIDRFKYQIGCYSTRCFVKADKSKNIKLLFDAPYTSNNFSSVAQFDYNYSNEEIVKRIELHNKSIIDVEIKKRITPSEIS